MSILNYLNPVSYTMHVSPIGENAKIALSFRCISHPSGGSRGFDGYTYSFNGRTYQDVASFRQEEMDEIARNVYIVTDIHGEKALKTYTQIPTFDSGDREWDSEELEILFFDGRNIHLVVMRGGYRIARLTFYEKLLSADIRMQPVFEKLGWPTADLQWV